MKEPVALNTLVSERNKLEASVRKLLPENLPYEIDLFFGEWPDYFTEQIVFRWRDDKRFDELIDYLVYQYGAFDGHPPWQELLQDLRFEKEEPQAIRLLEGLLKEREKTLEISLSKLEQDPNNLNIQVALTIHKASVLQLLAEMEFVIANKAKEDIDTAKVESLRKRMQRVQSYGQ